MDDFVSSHFLEGCCDHEVSKQPDKTLGIKANKSFPPQKSQNIVLLTELQFYFSFSIYCTVGNKDK